MKHYELKRWRHRSRLTQTELANMLGIAKTTIYRWEKAMREIPSFLHLALECLEMKGGVQKVKTKTDEYPIIKERIYLGERQPVYRASNKKTRKKKEVGK